MSFFTSPKNVRKLPLVYQKFLYCFFSKFLLFYCPLFSFFIHVANFIYNWIKRCDFHNRDAYGEGWLVKVKMSNPAEYDALLGAADYEKLIG